MVIEHILTGFGGGGGGLSVGGRPAYPGGLGPLKANKQTNNKKRIN